MDGYDQPINPRPALHDRRPKREKATACIDRSRRRRSAIRFLRRILLRVLRRHGKELLRLPDPPLRRRRGVLVHPGTVPVLPVSSDSDLRFLVGVLLLGLRIWVLMAPFMYD